MSNEKPVLRGSVGSNSATPCPAAHQAPLCPWNFPSRNTGVGCHFLLQGIFPTQGSKLCLLHRQADSLPLSQLGGPKKANFPLKRRGAWNSVTFRKLQLRNSEHLSLRGPGPWGLLATPLPSDPVEKFPKAPIQKPKDFQLKSAF